MMSIRDGYRDGSYSSSEFRRGDDRKCFRQSGFSSWNREKSSEYALHVRGYDIQRTRVDDIRRKFEIIGRVCDVYIPRDFYSQKLRGFCYVKYEHYDDAVEAKQRLDRTDVFGDGREITVMWATGSRKNPDQMRSKLQRNRRDEQQNESRTERYQSRHYSEENSRSPSPRRHREDRNTRNESRDGNERRDYSPEKRRERDFSYDQREERTRRRTPSPRYRREVRRRYDQSRGQLSRLYSPKANRRTRSHSPQSPARQEKGEEKETRR
mmetsp:Transcript_6489/g.11597  ORF Transcript_6489/g.11597 Transcript_6489/m.11597 type:complete len:267 (-) Transcript_6489:556-1356(-)